MTTKWKRNIFSAALVLGISGAAQPAHAGAFAWISAPNWSYSAAAAASPAGAAYFWGLSVGVGSFSWAYAFSVSPGVGAAYSFAEAAAGRGGMGATQVAGFADPYAGVSVDISLLNPATPSGYPTTDPSSDPLSDSYSVTGTGITFTDPGTNTELNGVDELQAFLYTGGTDLASIEAALGVSSDSGTSSAGDDSTLASLESAFGLTPLDAPVTDPSSLSTLNFTENDSSVNPADVILIGQGDAASVPEPGTAWGLAAGVLGLGLLALRRRRATA